MRNARSLASSAVVRDRSLFVSRGVVSMFDRTEFAIEVADYSDDGFEARYLLRAVNR
jgi:hypothetical protein